MRKHFWFRKIEGLLEQVFCLLCHLARIPYGPSSWRRLTMPLLHRAMPHKLQYRNVLQSPGRVAAGGRRNARACCCYHTAMDSNSQLPLAAPPEGEPGDSLARISRWRVVLVAACVGALPAELLVGVPLGRHLDSSIPFTLVAFFCTAAIVCAGVFLALFKCPACHKSFIGGHSNRFGVDWSYTDPFTARCLNCGFPSHNHNPSA